MEFVAKVCQAELSLQKSMTGSVKHTLLDRGTIRNVGDEEPFIAMRGGRVQFVENVARHISLELVLQRREICTDLHEIMSREGEEEVLPQRTYPLLLFRRPFHLLFAPFHLCRTVRMSQSVT